MRSPFTDRREDIVPRSLRDLLATDEAPATEEGHRRRRRRMMITRRGA
ncbi:MAG TPA: hypothetical protein VIL71_00130 [Spirillospora sp.]